MSRGKKNIIGHINNIVEGIKAHALYLLPQPLWRRLDLDVPDDYSAVTMTKISIQDLNINEIRSLLFKLD